MSFKRQYYTLAADKTTLQRYNFMCIELRNADLNALINVICVW